MESRSEAASHLNIEDNDGETLAFLSKEDYDIGKTERVTNPVLNRSLHSHLRILFVPGLIVMIVCALGYGKISILSDSPSLKISDADAGDKSSTPSLKETQIQNYIDGKALMLNVHITHHGGTTFCHFMKKLGPTPDFACMGGDNMPKQFKKKPWAYNETAAMIEKVRPVFHMISWEFSYHAHLQKTNWEDENLLSVIVMRHPVDRLLAAGLCGSMHGKMNSATPEMWWDYVEHSECTNNFALHVLTPHHGCCNGEETSVDHLEGAKDLLGRFTFVLDIECLDESLVALAEKLNATLELGSESSLHHTHPPAKTRLKDYGGGDNSLYRYLKKRNKLDIELYEWSKSLSLVKCSDLKH